MAVNWQFKVSITTILVIAAVLFIFISKPFSCDSGASHSSLSNAIKWLTSHDYTEAEAVNKPTPHNLPKPVQESAVSTTYGEGIWIPTETYTPADTVPVELTEVTLNDGSHWIKLTIDSVEVKWHRLEYYQAPEELGRWSGGLEVAILHGFDVGAFGAYRLGTLWGINGEVAVAVDINRDIAQAPDWIAGELGLSLPLWRSVEGRAAGGGLLSRDGLEGHVAGGVGIRF